MSAYFIQVLGDNVFRIGSDPTDEQIEDLQRRVGGAVERVLSQVAPSVWKSDEPHVEVTMRRADV